MVGDVDYGLDSLDDQLSAIKKTGVLIRDLGLQFALKRNRLSQSAFTGARQKRCQCSRTVSAIAAVWWSTKSASNPDG